MAKKTEQKVELKVEQVEVQIKPIELDYTTFHLIGETTYIPGKPPAYLADSMRALMDRRKGEPFPAKPPKMTPKEEAEACLWTTGNPKQPYGIPAGAFHGAFVQAAREILHLPVDNIRLFRVTGKVLPLFCDELELPVKDTVFRGKQKKEERTHFPVTIWRPHFNPPWYIDVTVVHKPSVIDVNTLGDVIQHAGQFIGVGQGRPGLGGHETNGVWLIEGTAKVLRKAA